MRALLMTFLMLFGAAAVSAQTFDYSKDFSAEGESDTIDFIGTDGNINDPGDIWSTNLSGELTVQLVEISGDGLTWTFLFDLSNTSSNTESGAILTSLGFTTSPPLPTTEGGAIDDSNVVLSNEFTYEGDTDATLADGDVVFDDIVLDNFSAHGVGMELVCVKDDNGADKCNAAGSGLASGESDAFFLSVTFDQNPGTVNFTNFVLRFGSLNETPGECIGAGDPDENFGCSGSGVAIPFVSVVPEPATWVMMIVGFGIVASFGRRRRRTVAQVA